MRTIAMLLPILFYLLVLAICLHLLLRGIKATFLQLFVAGALLYLVQSLSYVALSRLEGGLMAHAGYLKWLALVGASATALWAGAFLALAAFLKRGTNRAL